MPNPGGLPPVFLERLQRLFPESLYGEVLTSFSVPKDIALRLQKPGYSREDLSGLLRKAGLEPEEIEELPFPAFFVSRETFRKLQEHPLYTQGTLYAQGLSSMLAVLVLAPRPGEKVLDMAAAPGSKTSLIAYLMKGEGELTANDTHRGRFFRMKTILENQGYRHIRMTLTAGEAFGRREPESYDRVLLDAPCSGEARFQADDPKSLGFWKMMKVRDLAKKQKRLFLSAFSALKPGGVLVYSTCTFSPEENEGAVAAALKRIGSAAELEAVSLPPSVRVMAGLTSWENKVYPPALARACRIVPGPRTEGFFILRVRKTGPWRWDRGFADEEMA